MKRPVFQYKSIYWIAILVNITVLFLYGNTSYSILASSEIYTGDFISISLIIITWIFSLISLFFLIKKHRLSIIIHSVVIVLVILNFLQIIFKARSYKGIIKEGHTSEDYMISSVIYLVIFGIWLVLIQKYKFRDSQVDLQIEEIGKHTD